MLKAKIYRLVHQSDKNLIRTIKIESILKENKYSDVKNFSWFGIKFSKIYKDICEERRKKMALIIRKVYFKNSFEYY